MSQPTKLPDDLFPDDEWQQADYPKRVRMLLVGFMESRAQVHAQRARIEVLSDDLNDLRKRNARLLQDLEETGVKLAGALIQIGTQKLTTQPIEAAGK